MEVEEVFCSKSRMKLLKVIACICESNVTDLARRAGINFSDANKHLKVLEDEGILHQSTYGRIRLYRFNQTSQKAKAVQALIKAWEQPNQNKL